MATVHGSETFVSIAGTDFSEYTKTTEITDTDDHHDTTVYGRLRKRYHAGLGDGTITHGGVYDTTAVTGPAPLFKGLKAAKNAVPWIYRPEGTGAGLPQTTVDVLVKSYKQSAPVDDMVTWEVELQMTGNTLDETPQ